MSVTTTITAETIVEAIRNKRPDLTVEINEVIKNKQKMQGISIKSPSASIAPNIYVEPFIKHFEDVNAIADAILNTYEENKCLDGFNVSTVISKEYVLSHVLPVLQQESDEKLIKIPGIEKRFPGAEGYLAIVSEDENGMVFSIKLTGSILASAGIDIEKDKIFERALENLKDKVTITHINQFLNEFIDSPEEYEKDVNMYIISTKNKCKGAAAILCDEAMQEFAKKHGIKDGFWVVPSSVHECLLLFNSPMSVEEMNAMVREVNTNEVAPEDRLAEQVWYCEPLPLIEDRSF